MTVIVRAEHEADHAQVRALNLAAFSPSSVEADIVDALRDVASVVSLVAENVGQVIGHILFSPVTIATAPQCRLMGLGPMAVAAEHRNRGVGTALVEAGLKKLRRLGAHGIVVVGHPTYYPRFGFSPGEKSNLACEYDVPTEVFMVMELHRGAMLGVSGTVKYHEAFGNA